MLENAERERLGNVGQPDKPLIRLRVSPILFYFWVASILDKLNFIDFLEDSIAEFISLFRTFAKWSCCMECASLLSYFLQHPLKLPIFIEAFLDLPLDSIFLPLCPQFTLYILFTASFHSACSYLFTCLSSQSACEFFDDCFIHGCTPDSQHSA